jgi:stage V sporulation protein B
MNIHEMIFDLDRALKMGKDSATGSFHLFIARIVSTIVLAVSSIVIGWIIDDVDYGLYVVALIPITTFLLFQDWGVGAALTKYCARYRSIGEEGNLRNMILAGLSFEVSTGLALTLALFLLVDFIATVLGQPEAAFLIAVSSIAILFQGVYAASQTIFVGFERMRLTGLTMICQAIVLISISPLLVYLGYGALGLMIGYILSYVVAGIVSIFILYFYIYRKLTARRDYKFELFDNLKTLLRFGLPLAIGTLLLGLLTQFYSFMMAYFCDVAIIGHYKIATNFAILITFFTTPIFTVLFPVFSKINAETDRTLLRSIFSSSIKYTSLFAIPVIVAMIVMSTPMISTIYANKWFYSPFFLSLYLVQYLSISIGSFNYSNLLQGLGETKLLMKLNALTLCVGIPLALVLIPSLEIVGLIIASLVATLPKLLICMYWVWKHYQARVDFTSSAKILLASFLAGITTYLFLTFFVAAEWITLVIGTILFLIIYLFSVRLVGAITQSDVNSLRVMFSGLGIVSKLLNIPLDLIGKPFRINQKNTEAKEENLN